jgi:hypothetical protein
MNKKLPIRLKVELIESLREIIVCLHEKRIFEMDRLAEEIKKRALFLEEEIQGGVLRFIELVQFQGKYDSVITEEIQQEADRLIGGLGFVPPKQAL